MIRNTLLSIVALAALAGTASAGAKDIRYDGHKFVCHFERFKVKVGHDWYGRPIFKWRKKEICEKVYY